MDAISPVEPLSEGPLPAYRALVAERRLIDDPAQSKVAVRLQALWTRLHGYDPPRRPAASRLSRFLRRQPDETRPNGLYLVGAVGRGKSMLMNLFFAAAGLSRKRRIHFHQFMQNAHARIHRWKQENPDGADPIPPLADAIAAEAALLCFDEFQVNDIADAMILGRLFAALFERGVVIVATSNTAPDDLFAGQPGRDAFLPFIALIKQRLDELVLEGGRDFRRARLLRLPVWYVPADGRAERALDAAFAQLTGKAEPTERRLTVTGRELRVPLAAKGVARFDFGALCGRPLGPGDYLAIATQFHTLVVDAIPRFDSDNRDEMRRFITLIDTLYEHRVKLVASAAAMPDQLYQHGEDAKTFERTTSRLAEMQRQEYLALPHLT